MRYIENYEPLRERNLSFRDLLSVVDSFLDSSLRGSYTLVVTDKDGAQISVQNSNSLSMIWDDLLSKAVEIFGRDIERYSFFWDEDNDNFFFVYKKGSHWEDELYSF